MNTSAEVKQAGLSDYLAAERTFLAWVRTGLALMGFGFVVARFGLFLAELQLAQGLSVFHSHSFSLYSGTALIAAGIGVNLWAAWNHFHLVAELSNGRVVLPRSPKLAVALALFLALVGLAMAAYLTLIR